MAVNLQTNVIKCTNDHNNQIGLPCNVEWLLMNSEPLYFYAFCFLEE